jgi:outer membrane protein assembly factor BamB
VFVTAGCAQAWDLSPSTGALRWFHAESCAGAGGLTPLYSAGRLWVRASSGGLLLDAESGAVSGSFSAKVAPAVDEAASLALLFDGTTLRAIDVPSGTVAWTFVGDGALRSAPIAAGGFVYIGSGAGLLYALDEASGHVAFTATLPAPVLAPDESDLSRPLTGLAAGDGLLVVPSGHLLSAYH